ncbi:MAG TPA: DNA repair protein RecO [Planctomycetota bacterium]|nr:DNA repair protein RecO [Planctomycetota bacterium]
MTAPRGYRTDAIVVRVIDFAETSQVVHLVTPEHGLVSALAKGAHQPKSAFEGGIPFAVLGEADVLPRRSELELLRAFRVTDGLRGLRDDLDRFAAGEYVLGLLRAFSRHALAAPALFLAGATALKAISAAPPDQAPLWVAVFEARTLAATGHRPHFGSCVVCGGDDLRDLVFAPAAGGVAHRRCAPPGPTKSISAGDLAVLTRLYTARLPTFASEPPSVAGLKAARAVHDLFLPYVLEREPAGTRSLPRHG